MFGTILVDNLASNLSSRDLEIGSLNKLFEGNLEDRGNALKRDATHGAVFTTLEFG